MDKGKDRLDDFDQETFDRLMNAKERAQKKEKNGHPLMLLRKEVYMRKYYIRKERSLRIVDTYHMDQEERGVEEYASKMTHKLDTVLIIFLFSIVLFSILSMVGTDPLYSLFMAFGILGLGELPFALMCIYVNRGVFSESLGTFQMMANVLFHECFKTMIDGADLLYSVCRFRCRKSPEEIYSQPIMVGGDNWIKLERRREEDEEEGKELEVIDASRLSVDL